MANKIRTKQSHPGIHPLCQKCLKEHAKDWRLKNGKVYLVDNTGKEILHICNLIKEELHVTKSKAKDILSDDDLAFANFLYNPVLWAKTECD